MPRTRRAYPPEFRQQLFELVRAGAPIGDEIDADTPAEIAVSVVSDLIRLRRLGPSP